MRIIEGFDGYHNVWVAVEARGKETAFLTQADAVIYRELLLESKRTKYEKQKAIMLERAAQMRAVAYKTLEAKESA